MAETQSSEGNQSAIIARIDERTIYIKNTLEEIKATADQRHAEQKNYIDTRVTDLDSKLVEKVSVLHKRLDDMDNDLGEKVSNDAFAPVKKLTYGAVATIVVGIILAILLKFLGI